MNCPAARNCRKGQMCRLHDSRSPCHLSGNALMKPGWTIHFSSLSSACLRSKDIPCCTHHEVLLPQLRTVALSTCHLGHYPLPQGQPRIYRNPYPRHSHDLMSYMKTNNHASSLEPLHPRFAAAIGRSFSGLDSVALLLQESCAIAFICAGLSSGSCQNRWFCQSQIRPQLRGAISGGMRPIGEICVCASGYPVNARTPPRLQISTLDVLVHTRYHLRGQKQCGPLSTSP
jgi:hypothetical protein